jgi:hypothetical protein
VVFVLATANNYKREMTSAFLKELSRQVWAWPGKDRSPLSSRASSAASFPPMQHTIMPRDSRESPKTKLPGSAHSTRETLQSKVDLDAQNRLSLRGLAVLHRRLNNMTMRSIRAAIPPCGGAPKCSARYIPPNCCSPPEHGPPDRHTRISCFPIRQEHRNQIRSISSVAFSAAC